MSKDGAVDKIEQALKTRDRDSVDRTFIHQMTSELPRVFSWAVQQIGIETAFLDCDQNQDGIITVEEMRVTDTCLESCTKIAIVNMAL